MKTPLPRATTTPRAATVVSAAPAAVLEPAPGPANGLHAAASPRKIRKVVAPPGNHFSAHAPEEHADNRQAELFYLQKQIQLQTPMVFILEDSSRVQGIVEWYDRNSIKVRGKSRVLIYKSAIKYLYKAGEVGTGTDA